LQQTAIVAGVAVTGARLPTNWTSMENLIRGLSVEVVPAAGWGFWNEGLVVPQASRLVIAEHETSWAVLPRVAGGGTASHIQAWADILPGEVFVVLSPPALHVPGFLIPRGATEAILPREADQ
jgi:hypothetical protein